MEASDKEAVVNCHFTVQVNEPFCLAPILRAMTSASQDQHRDHGILTLQFRQLPPFAKWSLS
jgi:hypothetical protein